MTALMDTPDTAARRGNRDELSPLIAQSLADPQFRAAYEDATELHRILDTLVELRRARRLSQTQVAERMGVRQPTVSGFETESSDPRLSTLQRYARAVEGRLRLVLELPHCDWVSSSTTAYRPAPRPPHSRARELQHSGLVRDWSRSRSGDGAATWTSAA